MRKRLVCDLRVPFSVTLMGPVLVKSGASTVAGPDMTFVRTFGQSETGEQQIYLPGTSLKGVFRSQAERIVRTVREETRHDGKEGVCLPYANDPRTQGESCYKRFGQWKDKPRSVVYSESCLACRLFGCLGFAGRISISDAYPKTGTRVKTEYRDGVAIDRKTGGAVARAKFEFEVAVEGEFAGTILLENFEAWQMGLLGLVLGDMCDERLRVGMGSSRGLGHVKGALGEVELRYAGLKTPKSFCGIESLVSASERDEYQLFSTGQPGPALEAGHRSGLFSHHCLNWADFAPQVGYGIEELIGFVKKDPWPLRRGGKQ